MKNVKKVIAGVLLTATVLGTGTQLSVGAAKYSLEGSSSEVNFNKRPSRGQGEFDTDSEMDNSLADFFAKIKAQKIENLDDTYDEALNLYDIDSYKNGYVTIDECEEKWNEVSICCGEAIEYYNELEKRNEAEKYSLVEQLANANIAWLEVEKEPAVGNWNSVALKFEAVIEAIKDSNKDISANIEYIQAKADTARAYAAFVELNKTTNYNTVGNLLTKAAEENYSVCGRCDKLAEECVGKFEEIYNEVANMEQEGQNSRLLAEFTLMKNQIRLIQTDELCRYAGMRKLEEKVNMLNEAGRTYDELYNYFDEIGREEEIYKCIEGLQKIESGRYN